VLDRLGRIVGRPSAFLLQVLLFVYLHLFGPPLDLRAASHLALGAVMIGSFYLWSRSLLGAMALHLAYDVLASLSFGASLDGLTIDPLMVGDNLSLLHSHQASALFMSCLSIWMLWNARRPRQLATYIL
jgi:membrane protease YdiL (CAAX protease family)